MRDDRKLNLKVTPVWLANFEAPADKFVIINRGGTRSSKTWSLAQIFVTWLFTGQLGRDVWIMEGVASIVRKSYPILKATVLRDILDILHAADLYQYVKHKKVDKLFEYNGRTLEYFSLDDAQKVRGRGRSILWLNEANEVKFRSEYLMMAVRTKHRIYIDFNPDDPQIWINTRLEQQRADEIGDVHVIQSSYKQNPYLGAQQIQEIEYLEKTDPSFWTIFGLGEYGFIRGLVYPAKWTEIDKIPEGLPKVYGLDFGFNPNPAALIELSIDTPRLYLREILYETDLTNAELADMIKGEGIRGPIFADSAEPKAIKELKSYRLKVHPAEKGPDSLKDGIRKVKEFQIYVTRDSTNLINEKRRYKWIEDRDGNPTGQPVKAFDHLLDALRYGLTGTKTRRRKPKLRTA